ncbi:MAG: hypothetical protein ACOYMG_27710, partial [Candidatus Methylumidiphilus sp.]
TAAIGLVGLNSLDFVLADGVCLVLEINPRPSATIALYDEDFAEGLLALHVAACLGELPPLTRNAVDKQPEVGRNKPAPAGVSGKSTGRMPETVAARPYSGLRLNLKPTALPLSRHLGPVRALQIVYSPSTFIMPDGFCWPGGCADIPHPGTMMEAGQPLCSVLVKDKNRQEAETLVKSLENEILNGLHSLKTLNVGVASAAQGE